MYRLPAQGIQRRSHLCQRAAGGGCFAKPAQIHGAHGIRDHLCLLGTDLLRGKIPIRGLLELPQPRLCLSGLRLRLLHSLVGVLLGLPG